MTLKEALKLASEYQKNNQLEEAEKMFKSVESFIELKSRKDIIANFRQFAPHSPGWSGGTKSHADMTIHSAKQTIEFIGDLVDLINQPFLLEPKLISEIQLNQHQKELAEKLANTFDEYGSDKHFAHGYENLYAYLFANRNAPHKILEIGLGTNNIDIPSNMGNNGKPGASLRSYKECFPKAQIYGADIDKRILFTEERIQTYFVDQLERNTLMNLMKSLSAPMDFIIDDGLHAPNANINTLLFALNCLKPNGVLIIEDIVSAMLPIWELVAKILVAQEYQVELFKGKSAFVFVVYNK